MCYFNEHLVGDWESGNVYALDMETYTDNGDPIIRLRASQTTANLQKLIKFGTLQIDMETGVGISTGQGSAPALMLRWSNDGGHTWSNQRTASIGAMGEYGAEVKFNRLGSGKNRVWEISMSDPVKWCIFGAVLGT